jgi:hypothetical protein
MAPSGPVRRVVAGHSDDSRIWSNDYQTFSHRKIPTAHRKFIERFIPDAWDGKSDDDRVWPDDYLTI